MSYDRAFVSSFARIAKASADTTDFRTSRDQAACAGKASFDCRSMAVKVSKRRAAYDKLEPYRCRACSQWHLGLTMKGKAPSKAQVRAATTMRER